jgi:hypothetical protein
VKGLPLATLDDILEGLEAGDTVDEILKERLEGTRATFEEILERHEGGDGTSGALEEGRLGDTGPSAQEEL